MKYHVTKLNFNGFLYNRSKQKTLILSWLNYVCEQNIYLHGNTDISGKTASPVLDSSAVATRWRFCVTKFWKVSVRPISLQPAERGYSTPLFSLAFIRSSVVLYGLSYNLKTNEEAYFVNTVLHTSLYRVSPH